ncbi:MAG: PilT/PilU family type 4a pilus ATPase [Patescibacteria group bacterium]|jgi:twitching motility protein PilT
MDQTEQIKRMLFFCIETALERGASDIHLSPGAPPRIRWHGKIVDLDWPVINPSDTEQAMRLLLAKDNQDEVIGPNGDADFAKTFDQFQARFRGNICRTQNGLVIALRHLPNDIPAMEEIGLPSQVIQRLLSCQQGGIILVTGPTGSGKTTTLASMINYLNVTRALHIITVEAPVEYVHPHKRSSVDQREMPLDTPSFAAAVRCALRQDPDVILVGEMRDLETIAAAITAAETGHMVLATLHTNSAADTINRIIDAFPLSQQSQIRVQLATSLLAVISQRLLPRADDSGRVAAFELMINNTAIRSHIRDNKTLQINSTIETSKKEGMVRFDDHLAGLVSKRIVAFETALKFACEPKDFPGRVNR